MSLDLVSDTSRKLAEFSENFADLDRFGMEYLSSPFAPALDFVQQGLKAHSIVGMGQKEKEKDEQDGLSARRRIMLLNTDTEVYTPPSQQRTRPLPGEHCPRNGRAPEQKISNADKAPPASTAFKSASAKPPVQNQLSARLSNIDSALKAPHKEGALGSALLGEKVATGEELVGTEKLEAYQEARVNTGNALAKVTAAVVGKETAQDIRVAGHRVIQNTEEVVKAGGTLVKNAAETTARTFNEAADNAKKAAGQAVDNTVSAAKDAGKAVTGFVSKIDLTPWSK